MVRKLKSLLTKFYIKFLEHTYEDRLKYLFQKNHSDTLIVVFSGFTDKPMYNYVRTLQNIKADKIFMLDDFGHKGSYYWYENGDNKPMMLVKSLIYNMLNKKKYKRLITLGSSKGGTCAIYYGLMFGATDIYSGACQYRIGTYLNTADRVLVFKAMMGVQAAEKEQAILDAEMPQLITKYKGLPSRVHLLYSKEEHTYEDDIKYLIKDLDDSNINHDDKVETFTDHGEVGKYFSPWIKNELEKLINNG